MSYLLGKLIEKVGGWLLPIFGKHAVLAAKIGLGIVAALVVFVLVSILFKACFGGSRHGKIEVDEKALQEINSANADKQKKALEKVFQKIDDARNLDTSKIDKAKAEVYKEKRRDGDVTAEDLQRIVDSIENQ